MNICNIGILKSVLDETGWFSFHLHEGFTHDDEDDGDDDDPG